MNTKIYTNQEKGYRLSKKGEVGECVLLYIVCSILVSEVSVRRMQE